MLFAGPAGFGALAFPIVPAGLALIFRVCV
jgi:hypothetical protein